MFYTCMWKRTPCTLSPIFCVCALASQTSSLKHKHHLKKMPLAFLSGSLVPGEPPLLLRLPDSLLRICCTVCSCPAFAQQRLPFPGVSAPQCWRHSSNQHTALRDWHLSIMSYFFGRGTQLTWSWKADLWWQESPLGYGVIVIWD